MTPQLIEQLILPAPHKLRPYQSKILDIVTTSKTNVFVKARQLGFTSLGIGLCYVTAMTQPNTQVGFMSSNANYIKHKFSKVALPFDTTVRTTRQQKTVVEFINGSSIHLLDQDNSYNLRGVSLELLVLDEFAWFDDPVNSLLSAIPTTANGRLMAYTSVPLPGTRSRQMFDRMLDYMLSSTSISPLVFPWFVNQEFTKDWYLDRQAALGEEAAKTELDCAI